ncbi:hypothetical protein BDB00DRAFT_821582 [Zychaea mexicana]|uniref:uncharacterized protein n=1 Tax=Zychaea mexicana TaxID=64656 RepID=UPI0022FDE3E8|nr:uncharacterized protein BDB00DRAFT_821582 [Zychaea mexicana]KAI9493772.1 hypothetical protein BDB00DRAFT_821582 [Zychaea mexicana]
MLPEFSLKGKKAIVTGGARGLGLEICRGLAESGADVALMYVSSDKTHDTAAEIGKEFNVTCKAYKANIADAKETQEAIDQIHKDFGRIDVFVANAGISQNGNAETFDLNDWKHLFDVNVHGVFYGVQAVSKHMLEQGSGSIILMSSVSAYLANQPQYQCAYNCTKASVSMMGKCLAYEWGTRGIRVNSVCPGYMRTDMLEQFTSKRPDLAEAWNSLNPMKRMGVPKEIKGAVVFLASEASSYITGSDLFVDGGYTAM